MAAASTLRQRLVRLHRWFGLLASVWLLGICLSGAVIAFDDELDAWLNPDLFQASAQGSVPDAIAAAQARHPDRTIRFVLLDAQVSGLVRMGVKDAAGDLHELFADSGTGKTLGERAQGVNDLGPRHLVATVYRLHHEFLGGATLAWFLGLVALLWALDHLVALGIAFTNRHRWGESFRIRRGARGFKLHFDLHRAAGVWLWPITFMLSMSGLYFNWHKDVTAVLGRMNLVTPELAEQARAPVEPKLTWPQAYARFAAIAAPEPITSFSFDEGRQAWRSRMRDPRDLSPNGMRIVWLSADGRLIRDRHETTGTATDKLLAWMFPLHSGMAFGLAGRIVIAASGLLIAVMIVTGLLIFSRKLLARRLHAGRRGPQPVVPAVRPPLPVLATQDA
jgi:uncharacterized iron-regulated membrane protein